MNKYLHSKWTSRSKIKSYKNIEVKKIITIQTIELHAVYDKSKKI